MTAQMRKTLKVEAAKMEAKRKEERDAVEAECKVWKSRALAAEADAQRWREKAEAREAEIEKRLWPKVKQQYQLSMKAQGLWKH